MPLADALLWNCRGDLHKTTDGCTSAALKSADGTRWIGHNEDGDPYLYGRCHLVDVALDDAPGYLGFYPGSLPGHTFGANRAGLVQTINNLRARQRHEGVPRMFARGAGLCHAGRGLLLRATPCAGAFITRWARRRTPGCSASKCCRRCLYTGNRRALRPRQPHDPRRHRRPASSRHRFVARSTASKASSTAGRPRPAAPSCWPRCTIPRAHCRSCATDRHDPDGENTLATAVFEIGDGEVTLRVYDQAARGIALDVMNDPE